MIVNLLEEHIRNSRNIVHNLLGTWWERTLKKKKKSNPPHPPPKKKKKKKHLGPSMNFWFTIAQILFGFLC